MAIFIIREKEDGVLVPLKHVVRQMPFLVAATWCFRKVEVLMGRPFGLTVQEFEKLAWETPNGYCVSDDDMRQFMDADIQIVDGEIDAMAEDGTLLATIECVDTTQWEIHTSSADLALRMREWGFVELIE